MQRITKFCAESKLMCFKLINLSFGYFNGQMCNTVALALFTAEQHLPYAADVRL